MDTELTLAERKRFHILCLEMVATLRLPLNMFEANGLFRRILELIRPAAAKDIPTAKNLGGSLLNEEARGCLEETLPLVKGGCAAGKPLCVGVDGFGNVSKEHVFGVVVGCGGASFALDDGAGNRETGDQHHGLATAELLEQILGSAAETVGVRVRALCTDEAGENGRAKRILALRLPDLYLARCLSHHNALTAKQLLRLDRFRGVIQTAAGIVKVIRKSERKWKPRLDAESVRLYQQAPSLCPLFDVRWNTAQACVASCLNIKTALEGFWRPFRSEPKFPVVLLNLEEPRFWEGCRKTYDVLLPLTIGNMIMQRDSSGVSDAVFMFGTYVRASVSAKEPALMQVVRSRWDELEHPIFLMAWFLDVRFIAFFNEARTLTAAESTFPVLFLADVVLFYYIKWFGDDTDGLAAAVGRWVLQTMPEIGKYKLTSTFWDLMLLHHDAGTRKLARMAVHVSGLPIQTANCERLFSDYGRQKSKARHRLDPAKVHKLTSVRMRVLKRVAKMGAKGDRIRSPLELPLKLSGPQLRASAVARRPVTDDRDDEDEETLMLLSTALPDVIPPGGVVLGSQFEHLGAQRTRGLTAGEVATAIDVADGGEEVESAVSSGDESDESDWEDAPEGRRRRTWYQRCFGDDEPGGHEQDAEQPSGPLFVSWDVATEVAAARYDDGARFRRDHPYPDVEDKRYPQECVTGLRAMKLPLQYLFPQSLQLPSMKQIYGKGDSYDFGRLRVSSSSAVSAPP
eukprot:GHVU01141478.1.p1 GENE.GHVU01141478.1~~GHVU01141478.1.p1  ORF type:complete len:741 (-),score=98.90 GHVU01141478.1:997-3219(-)